METGSGIKSLQRRQRKHIGGVAGKVVSYVVLSIWALTTIYPFIWVLQNAFKVRRLIRQEPFAIPTGDMFTLDNFEMAFRRAPIFDAYRTSLFISGTVTVVVILLAGLAAYGLARYNFRGRRVLQSLVIAAMMFPAFSTIIPVYRMEASWGIVNTNSWWLSGLSVILPQIAGNLSFAVVVLMGYIRSLSVELEEAAYLEGYSVRRIFFRIVMPLAKPSFATVAIFTFLWSYNDLLTQLFFLRDKNFWGITRLLNEVSSQAGTNYGMLFASITLVVVPVLIVYIILQKNIVKGLTAGAIKG